MRNLDKRTLKAIKEYKNLKDYDSDEFKGELNFTFTEMMIYYLAEGDPIRGTQLKRTNEKMVNDYYYQKKISDLNSLIEHIAYLKYLKEQNEK